MRLVKDGQAVNLTNEIQIDAYLKSGWKQQDAPPKKSRGRKNDSQ